MMLMITLQMVNNLNIKQNIYARNTPERPGNDGDVNRPPVSSLIVEFTILLTYLSSFWRFLDFSLINCKIELDLSWTKYCALIEKK